MIKTLFFDADETLYSKKHLKIRAELKTAEYIASEAVIDLSLHIVRPISTPNKLEKFLQCDIVRYNKREVFIYVDINPL